MLPILIYYYRVVQLLHSCGPLFKIIRVCGPQPAKNTYFCPKIRMSSKKKKGLQLESISKIPILVPKSGCSLKKKKVFSWNRSTKFLFSSQNHSVLQKKKLPLLVIDKTCAKLFRGPHKFHPRARSWTTLYY